MNSTNMSHLKKYFIIIGCGFRVKIRIIMADRVFRCRSQRQITETNALIILVIENESINYFIMHPPKCPVKTS